MMRTTLAVALFFSLVACRKSSDVSPERHDTIATIAAPFDASAPLPVADAGSLAHDAGAVPTSDEPMLVSLAEKYGMFVFLEAAEKEPAPEGVALTLYTSSYMVSAGYEIPASRLSPEGRSHLADSYLVGTRTGATCVATREKLLLIHRITEDDPTMGKDPNETPAEYTKRAFDRAEQSGSYVAQVRFAGKCGGTNDITWAVPSAASAPSHIPMRKASARDVAAIMAAVRAHPAHKEAVDMWKVKKPSRVDVQTFGHWAWATATFDTQETPVPTKCFILDLGGAPAVKAAPLLCPGSVEDAIEDRHGAPTFFFAHSKATLVNDEAPVTYFPTAYFGPSGGI